MTPVKCGRDGCSRIASGDEYCSAECCRVAHGLEQPFDVKAHRNQKRRVARLRKKHGDYIEVTNPDASAHLAPGSAGSGPRQQRALRYRK